MVEFRRPLNLGSSIDELWISTNLYLGLTQLTFRVIGRKKVLGNTKSSTDKFSGQE